MKRITTRMLAAIIGFGMTAVVIAQTVPPLINYQGRLTDPNGTPLPDGKYQVTFRLWDDPTASATNAPNHLIWGRTYDVNLVGGTFDVMLGASGGTSVDGAVSTNLTSAFSSSKRFLGLTITQNTAGKIPPTQQREIQPRQQLLSVPFALKADSLGAFALSGTLATQTVQTSGKEVALDGLSVTVHASGKPLMVKLVPGDQENTSDLEHATDLSYVYMAPQKGPDRSRARIELFDGDHRLNSIAMYIDRPDPGLTTGPGFEYTPSSFSWIEVPSSGMHTYSIKVYIYENSGAKEVVVADVRLLAYEL